MHKVFLFIHVFLFKVWVKLNIGCKTFYWKKILNSNNTLWIDNSYKNLFKYELVQNKRDSLHLHILHAIYTKRVTYNSAEYSQLPWKDKNTATQCLLTCE